MPNLTETSIAIIRAGQANSGAYVASPTFSQYGYSWLRDGTWIALGMDHAGQADSARAFHLWAAKTLQQYEYKTVALVDRVIRGEIPNDTDYLPTRFQLDGTLGVEDWPDFQLDGYGAWLWGLVQFVERHHDTELWSTARPAVKILVLYLNALWQSPNYDCWEEHRHQIHPATLAALYGGLNAVCHYEPELVPVGLPETIRDFVLTNGVASAGHFMKYLGNDAVDSSLLWLALPYRLVEPSDPRFLATVTKIEADIYRSGGGVYRYTTDTYFGGGEWLLLTLWLAWAYLELDRPSEAQRLVTWVEAQATANGELPEQVAGHLLDASYYDTWVARWGNSANPLLWSHGMYLLLKSLMKDE